MTNMLEAIIEWAVELLRADGGEIFLWDEQAGRLVQSIGYGNMEQYIGLALKPGDGIVGRVFQSRQPMIVDDYANWPGRLEVYVLERNHTDITVPMEWQERMVGVLGITADPQRRRFGQEDIRLATTVGNLAALAIHNHRLCEALQDRALRTKAILEQQVAERTAQLAHRARQLETSARVGRQITSILDTEALVSSVVNLISEAFDYPCVRIYLRDQGSDTLVLRASTLKASQPPHRLAMSGGGPIGMAASTNQPALVRDISQYPQYTVGYDGMTGTRSGLVIPLRMGNRVLGTLEVQSRRLDDFGENDIRLIQSLGDQIAIAVENARLYNSSRRLAALEERSYLARELHDSVTQLLFSMTLTSEALRMTVRQNLPGVEKQLDRLQDLAHQAMDEMRALIHQLRPGPEVDQDIVARVQDHIAEREKRDGLHVALQVEGQGRLSARREMALIRVLQEALNNVVKHAQTDEVAVGLRFDGSRVVLQVEDEGIGFDLSEPGLEESTLGLTSMRERVELLGGTFGIESQPGKGTRITVEMLGVGRG